MPFWKWFKRVTSGTRNEDTARSKEGTSVQVENSSQSDHNLQAEHEDTFTEEEVLESIETITNNNKYVVFAAIDFGTTHSGYAFSFKHDKSDIKMNKNWYGDSLQNSYKTPTSVLTGSNDEFIAFGHEAEVMFCEKIQDGEVDSSEFNLFRNFKMALYKDKQKIHLNRMITSTSGKSVEAMGIFVMALTHLKGHMFSTIDQSSTSQVDNSLVKWVVTVPAIWKDGAKRFMREACFKAGLIANLESKQLVLALEPEAASIYCSELEINQFYCESDEAGGIHYKAGDKYLVVDAGGGTVDISAHEILPSRDIREILPPSGGPWGGIFVDQDFEKYMAEIFGEKFINKYRETKPMHWFNVMKAFEQAKTSVVHDKESSINISLNMDFCESFCEFRGGDKPSKVLTEWVKSKSHLDVMLTAGFLRISYQRVKSFFQPFIKSMVDHIEHLINQNELNDLKYIMVVGGFGQCNLLQDKLFKSFAGRATILIPLDAQLAVIKGAVMFGYWPHKIQTRIAKYTYGYGCSELFREGIHDEDYAFIDSNYNKMCSHIFGYVIKAGKVVNVETNKSFELSACESSHRKGESSVNIYYTERNDVRYTTEESVQKLATLIIRHKKEDLQNTGFTITFEFGGTETYIYAKSTTGGDIKEFIIKDL